MNPDQDIVIDRVDENDEVMWPISRKNIFREQANFRTSHIFVFNPGGELLLQQLASTRERYPGRWGSSVAGYVLAGETYQQAAERKLQDELGIDKESLGLELVGKTEMADEGRKKFITLYKAVYKGKIKPNTEQMDDAKYFALKEITEMRQENEDQFTPTFLFLLDYHNQKK